MNPRRVYLFHSHRKKGLSGFGSGKLQYREHIDSQKSFFILFTYGEGCLGLGQDGEGCQLVWVRMGAIYTTY